MAWLDVPALEKFADDVFDALNNDLSLYKACIIPEAGEGGTCAVFVDGGDISSVEEVLRSYGLSKREIHPRM